MREVSLALLPAAVGLWWWFGWGVLTNIILAAAFALASEALILRLRKRPLGPALGDGSALLTALLLALAMPPMSPWWLLLIGCGFAIIFGKQLFGGLGYNPFNPAMVGYVVLLISFPLEMSSWLSARGMAELQLGLGDTLAQVFGTAAPLLDSISGATPLDTLKTELGLGRPLGEITTSGAPFGQLGGLGWEVVAGLYLLGGLWLIWRRIISWQVPVGMLATLALLATVFHAIDPERYAGALFHLFSGAAMLGAFFIATDPVSGASSPRGRLIFGIGAGFLVFVIRTWGGYPDGVAFAVLLMNMTAPTIDYYTQPRVFGHNGK